MRATAAAIVTVAFAALAGSAAPHADAAAPATAPSAFPACSESGQLQIEQPAGALIFSPQSVEHFRAGNHAGYGYFTVVVQNGKIDGSVPDSPYIDKDMRETLIEAAQAFVFLENGQPCTPPDTSVLVKFYADGEMQIGPDKHALTASPSPAAHR